MEVGEIKSFKIRMEQEQKHYYAFISYNHADKKEARDLQRWLEYYKLPNKVRKDNPDLPQYVRPLFRDETHLDIGELTPQICGGLEQSQFLIVICSPRSANSKWVNKEIEYFISLGRQDKILPYIIEGIPHAKNPIEECYPPALLSLCHEKEILGANINESGKDSAAIRVVAKMFGLRSDVLYQRYQKERQRKIASILFSVAAFVLLLLSFLGYVIVSNSNLQKINFQLTKKNAQLITNEANRLIDEGNLYEGIDTLFSSIPDMSIGDSLIDGEIETTLRRADYLLNFSKKSCVKKFESIDSQNYGIVQDQNCMWIQYHDTVYVYDIMNGRLIHNHIVATAIFDMSSTSLKAKHIVGVDSLNIIRIWEARTGRIIRSSDKILDVMITEGYVDPTMKYIITFNEYNQCQIFSYESLLKLSTLPIINLKGCDFIQDGSGFFSHIGSYSYAFVDLNTLSLRYNYRVPSGKVIGKSVKTDSLFCYVEEDDCIFCKKKNRNIMIKGIQTNQLIRKYMIIDIDVKDLDVSADNRYICFIGNDDNYYYWCYEVIDVITNKRYRYKLKNTFNQSVWDMLPSITFSKEGKDVYIKFQNNIYRVNMFSGEQYLLTKEQQNEYLSEKQNNTWQLETLNDHNTIDLCKYNFVDRMGYEYSTDTVFVYKTGYDINNDIFYGEGAIIFKEADSLTTFYGNYCMTPNDSNVYILEEWGSNHFYVYDVSSRNRKYLFPLSRKKGLYTRWRFIPPSNILFISNDSLYYMNYSTGKTIHVLPVENFCKKSSIIAQDSLVILSTCEGFDIFCVDSNKIELYRKIKERNMEESTFRGMIIKNLLIYCLSGSQTQNYAKALDIYNGEYKWTMPIEQCNYPSYYKIEKSIDNKCIAVFNDHKLFIIDIATGELLNSFSTKSVIANATLGRDVLAISYEFDNYIYIYNTKSMTVPMTIKIPFPYYLDYGYSLEIKDNDVLTIFAQDKYNEETNGQYFMQYPIKPFYVLVDEYRCRFF